MPNTEAHNPSSSQTELVYQIDQKEQLDSLIKFYGESALEAAEGIAKLLENEDGSFTIQINTNDNDLQEE